MEREREGRRRTKVKQKLNKMQTVSERESFIFEPIMTVLQKELGSCVTVGDGVERVEGGEIGASRCTETSCCKLRSHSQLH